MAEIEELRKKTTWKMMLPTNLPYINYVSLANGRCADLEFSWLKCADVTGLKNSRHRCKNQYEDYLECRYQIKTLERKRILTKERLRQGRMPIPVPDPEVN